MEIPETAWDRFAEWLSGFGTGATGFLVLAMVLLALITPFCLPRMWKDWLDYRKSTKELEPEIKKIDLLLTEKIERLAARGVLKVEVEPAKSRKERKR